MTKNILFTLIFILLLISFTQLHSQVTGGKGDVFEQDSIIIFDSPVPLLTLSEINKEKKSAFGADILLSGSGFGGGLFWHTELNKEFSLVTDFFISGARKSDELESFDRRTGELFVPFKKNRLFNIPLSLSLKYFPFNDAIINTFKPFISAGGGFSFIIATPYDQSFFSAFGDGVYYTRPSINLSLGADFGNKSGSLSIFQLRYFNIPFGGSGLESLDEELSGETPITNFGGIFLDLRIGFNF